ncbi:hypothetical protein ACWY4P_33210 [Streptomyces sp. LZ34]
MFEPGEPLTRPPQPHPWWDAVQARLEATETDCPGLTPVIEAVVAHIGIALDDSTVEGPLLSVLMEDAAERRTPPRDQGNGTPAIGKFHSV